MNRPHVSLRAALPLLTLAAVQLGCGGLDETRPIGTGATVVHTVGTVGASITLEEVTLTIPPGALDAEEEIRITSTFEVPGDGVTNYTPVFKFEPEGLTFRHPVEAQFVLPENAPSDVVVYWSRDHGDGFDQLETRVEGRNVYAFTRHFSSAFAGQASTPDAGTDAGTDAGSPGGHDAGWDAGSDAGWDAGMDAGFFPDAGFDAGMPTDAGSAPDGGMTGDGGFFPGTDAGTHDGGSAPDAGWSTPDGGLFDAGTPTDGGSAADGGSADAGSADAGSALDGGSAPDAG